MKMKKRLSLLTAFMLLFMITFQVAGAFAAENKQEATIKENSKQGEQIQKNNEAAEKAADQNGKSSGDVKAASTENDPESKEDTDSETIGQAQNNSDQETNNPDESENSANQEDNQEQNTEENNGQEESNASEENNGQEEDTPVDSKNESSPTEGAVPGNENKSTQIHLHIDKCVNPVETAYVQIDGEWEEMTNPGSSPLFKAFDEGEFIKDDVTAFKLIFTSGEELVVPISDVRVGVEAEGSVNYWLDECEIPAEEPSEPEDSEETDETMTLLSMIKIMIDETPRQIEKVTLVMISGERVEFERINELFSLTLTEEVQLELIRGIEIVSNGETKLILLSGIETLEIVESVLTLQVNWNMDGEIVEKETDEVDETEGTEEEEEEDTEEESETTAPGNDSGSGNTSDGTTNEQVWNGEVLPQTGESSRTMFYVLGFLIAAGGVLLRFRNPLKN